MNDIAPRLVADTPVAPLDAGEQPPAADEADSVRPIKLLDQLPAGMAEVGVVAILSNGRAMAVELRFPEGTVVDERDPSHVFAWYIAHAAPDLLVAAVNAWHTQRRVTAAALAAQEAEATDEQIVVPNGGILDADGKPIV